jgi:hypothetical protein
MSLICSFLRQGLTNCLFPSGFVLFVQLLCRPVSLVLFLLHSTAKIISSEQYKSGSI